MACYWACANELPERCGGSTENNIKVFAMEEHLSSQIIHRPVLSPSTCLVEFLSFPERIVTALQHTKAVHNIVLYQPTNITDLKRILNGYDLWRRYGTVLADGFIYECAYHSAKETGQTNDFAVCKSVGHHGIAIKQEKLTIIPLSIMPRHQFFGVLVHTNS